MTAGRLRFAWALVGVCLGVGLASLGSRPTLLVVPGALLGVMLAWQVGPSRETAAVLAGLAALPVVLAVHRLQVDCRAGGLDDCLPRHSPLPFALAAVVLVAVGVLLSRRARTG